MHRLAAAEWMITTDICHWITIFQEFICLNVWETLWWILCSLAENTPNERWPWISPLCVSPGVKLFLQTDGFPAEFVMLWLIDWRSGLSQRRCAGHWRHPIVLKDMSDSLTFSVTQEKLRKSVRGEAESLETSPGELNDMIVMHQLSGLD